MADRPKTYSEFLHDIWGKDTAHQREMNSLTSGTPMTPPTVPPPPMDAPRPFRPAPITTLPVYPHPGNRQVPVGNMPPPGRGWNRPDFPGGQPPYLGHMGPGGRDFPGGPGYGGGRMVPVGTPPRPGTVLPGAPAGPPPLNWIAPSMPSRPVDPGLADFLRRMGR